jgi:hypothetical protein
MLRVLKQFLLNRGYDSSSAELLSDPNSLGPGSQNVILTGTGKTRIFNGFSQLKRNLTNLLGSKVAFNVGDDFAGLGNATDSAGFGSVFRVLGALFYIGAGRLFFNGTETSSTASSILKIQKFQGNILQDIVYQAGLAQPSAPTIAAIAPPAGFIGKNDGTVSVRIARVRSATGARSIASLASNVVACRNQSVRVTFPEADDNGQDFWEIDVTLNGFGGVGNHYFLQEVPESAVSSTASTAIEEATGTFTGTNTIKVSNSVLASNNLGWIAESRQSIKTVIVDDAYIIEDFANVELQWGSGDTFSGSIQFSVLIPQFFNTSQIANLIRTALAANVALYDRFVVSGTNADIIVSRKFAEPQDNIFNLAITFQDPNMAPLPTSTLLKYGLSSYITGIGASDSGGTGFQAIQLETTHGITSTIEHDFTFRRAVTGVPRSYVIEWRDSDLAGADFAPIRDYPPPAGTFGGVLGDVTFVDGAYSQGLITSSAQASNARGSAIAVSDPVRPESFPPDNYLFTNDTPVALFEGGQGLYWRFGRNSLGVIRYVGGSPALSFETLWKGVGIQAQTNACLGGGGRLYAYTGTRGAIRLGMGGEPDTQFAARVADDMAAWNPLNVALGYDPNYTYVFYAHERQILCFYEAAEMWCAPIVLPDDLMPGGLIRSFVTVNSESAIGYNGIYIAIGDSETINLYSFNTGTGSVGKFVTQWNMAMDQTELLARIKMGLRADAPSDIETKIYINGDSEPVREMVTHIPSAGVKIPSTLRPNVRQARLWKTETTWESNGGDAGLEFVIVEGDTSGITT